MTSLVLLAVLLAAGWYFYRHWRYTRFEALHHPGHPQYFGAALCAVYLFAIAAPLHTLAGADDTYGKALRALEQLVPLQTGEHQKPANLSLHLALTLLTLPLAALLPILFNIPLIRTRSLAQLVAMRHGAIDQLESLAIKCEKEGTLCGLSLDNGKFYAGFLEEFTGPRLGKDWVAMTPVASGYRDEKSALSLTTFYDIQLPGQRSQEVFKVVISTKEIVSAQSFDLALYQEFQSPQIELEGISLEDEEPELSTTAPRGSSSSSLEKIRYYLYLGLPALVLAAPYAAILKPGTGGWWCLLFAGLSAKLAEALPIQKKTPP
ncbi:hypothetical protein [Pseudoxanthomonas mexicana]|uniref:hypothetical protein n=1 Tax=Pseudoxanthomonas mexicana TaxID=128785 RepID=UPI0028A128F9|nr:hypothetical protein [Pseudoxanthomonas mexicana]